MNHTDLMHPRNIDKWAMIRIRLLITELLIRIHTEARNGK